VQFSTVVDSTVTQTDEQNGTNVFFNIATSGDAVLSNDGMMTVGSRIDLDAGAETFSVEQTQDNTAVTTTVVASSDETNDTTFDQVFDSTTTET
jgi:hypothetical protein